MQMRIHMRAHTHTYLCLPPSLTDSLTLAPPLSHESGELAWSGIGLLLILQVIAGAAWTPHPNPYTPHPKPRVILQVMTGAAARLAGQQDAKYGAHKNKATAAAWRAYTASTPGLVFPGVAWPPVRPKVGPK